MGSSLQTSQDRKNKILTKETFKEALAKYIAKDNLSFLQAESESLIELLELCNPEISQFLVKADAIAEYITQEYCTFKTDLKGYFKTITSSISITCDIWTSPNGLAILGITAHWVDNEFILREVILDSIELQGTHSGKNIGNAVLECLKQLEIETKLFCITADNASNNNTMAQELAKYLAQFDSEIHIIGCVGHVINLAAKQGLKVLSTPNSIKSLKDPVEENEPTDGESGK